jgi:acetyl-CoA carboxylase biotin carboxyl carrier protein
VRDGDVRLRISKSAAVAAEVMPAAFVPPAAAPADEPEPEETGNLHRILAPMAAMFYRSPSPGAPPFVEAGDTVTPSTTLCVLEAMKAMNEIKAEVSGKIVKIGKQNGESVNSGDVLFLVQPS